MSQNFIDIFTRLKMKINKDVIVSFYRSYGQREIKKFNLIDVNGFSNIVVENDEGQVSIPFFGMDAIIETISISEIEKPIYSNPYVNENSFSGFYTKFGVPEQMSKQVFGNSDIDCLIMDRAHFICEYNKKDFAFEYDDLFFSEKQREEFNYFFSHLITELEEYAKKQGLDSSLSIINKGTTSIVYKIGDKIVKIGKPRRQPMLPYCEYLLQPIINRVFEFDGYPIHIEVTEEVMVCKNDAVNLNIDDETFQSIAIELRKQLMEIGLKADDMHSGNVGILLKDNKIHYGDERPEIGDDFSTSIVNNNNLRIKKKGECVLIDLDLIEIKDVNKYSNYLRNIGMDEERIQANLQAALKARR